MHSIFKIIPKILIINYQFISFLGITFIEITKENNF